MKILTLPNLILIVTMMLVALLTASAKGGSLGDAAETIGIYTIALLALVVIAPKDVR